MLLRSFCVVLVSSSTFLAAYGCASAQRGRADALEARISRVSGPPYAVGSAVGDWVEYRYSGSFRSRPLIVRKQVMSVAPDQLLVEITLIREGRQRSWREIVQVSRESESEAHESSEHVPGIPPNMPFHAWILANVALEGHIEVRPCRMEFAGSAFSCECRRGRVSWKKRQLEFIDPVCPGFSFAHGPSIYRDRETGEMVLEVEVLRAGRMFFRARDLGVARAP